MKSQGDDNVSGPAAPTKSAFIPKISAVAAKTAVGMFDSELELPSGRDLNQNAWLTIRLNIKLNFVDRKNPLAGKTSTVGGKFCAKDWTDGTVGGYLFPLRDWDNTSKSDFRKRFEGYEKVWNWQFVLITPRNCNSLDVTTVEGPGWVIRPNVLCLFRLGVDKGTPHATLNVYRLDRTATKATKPGQPDKQLAAYYAANVSPFRSDAINYVDMDVFDYHTIAHELGHRLDQDHILGLKSRASEAGGDATCVNFAPGQGAIKCYGTGMDGENVMGSGKRIFLINALSWLERIAEHTKTSKMAWTPTGIMTTPPRKMPLTNAVVEGNKVLEF
jgi:hypothetical protein